MEVNRMINSDSQIQHDPTIPDAEQGFPASFSHSSSSTFGDQPLPDHDSFDLDDSFTLSSCSNQVANAVDNNFGFSSLESQDSRLQTTIHSFCTSPSPTGIESLTDSMVTMFGLSDKQYEKLQVFYQLGDSLTYPDLATRLFSVAANFGLQNTISSYNEQLKQFGETMDEIKTRLENNFKLTNNQRKEIIALSKDKMITPAIALGAEFCTVYTHVEAAALAQASALGLPMKLNAANEFAYKGEIRQICTTVCQNVWRDLLVAKRQIKASLSNSKNRRSLDKAVMWLVEKLSKSGRLQKSSVGQKAIIVILRFLCDEYLKDTDIVDDINLCDVVDDGESDMESEDADEVPLPKKRKQSPEQGRKKRKSYWSVVDAWFANKVKAWGNNMGSRQWDQFIKVHIELDNEKWGSRARGIGHIPSLSYEEIPIPMPAPPIFTSNTRQSEPITQMCTTPSDPVKQYLARQGAPAPNMFNMGSGTVQPGQSVGTHRGSLPPVQSQGSGFSGPYSRSTIK
ncbi:hypothetical protein FRC03_012597 [Tulasnella sp. 419]|nr:hypothetical protein FRC03_012597 [Tulasnella sp. 419]